MTIRLLTINGYSVGNVGDGVTSRVALHHVPCSLVRNANDFSVNDWSTVT